METMWTGCWNSKYRKSVNVESDDSKQKVLQEKAVFHTDSIARVYRSDDRGPDS